MIRRTFTYAAIPVGWILASIFMVSLMWCGDVDCLTESAEDECTSLICSLVASNHGPSRDEGGDDSSDCTCVCHMLLIHVTASELDYCPPATDCVAGSCRIGPPFSR